jgi:hypothetical protein
LLGEFYTPVELSEIIIKKGVQHLANDTNALDLSCGSGSLLLAYLNQKQGIQDDEHALNVVGIDINPLAIIMSKFALGFFQQERGLTIHDPMVFCADSLITYANVKDSHAKPAGKKKQPSLNSFLTAPPKYDNGNEGTKNRLTFKIEFLGTLYPVAIINQQDSDLVAIRATVQQDLNIS